MLVDLKEKNMNQLKKGDLFTFDGKQLIPLTREELFKEIKTEIKELKEASEIQEKRIDKTVETFDNKINKFIKAFTKGKV